MHWGPLKQEKNFPPSMAYSSDLILVSSLLRIVKTSETLIVWSTEERFVTLLGRLSQMQEKRCQTNCKKGGDGVYDTVDM